MAHLSRKTLIFNERWSKNMLGLREITEYFQFIWMGLLIGYDFYRAK